LQTSAVFCLRRKKQPIQLIRAVQAISNISLSDRPTFSFRCGHVLYRAL
jgi:hypothetical protein